MRKDRRFLHPGSPWSDPAALNVLVADEDPTARAGMQTLLGAGVSATFCSDGMEALWHAGRVDPVVVVLSATLPGLSAAGVASVVSRHRDGVQTIVVGVGKGQTDQAGPVLAAGADGVVSRPYRAQEIEPLLRSYLLRLAAHHQRTAVLRVGALELNGPAFEAWAAGRPLRLALRDFEMLRLFMTHAGGVVSFGHIRRELWESRGESVSSNTIAVHVRHLRLHLQGVADIVSVRGVGYRLGLPVQKPSSREDAADAGARVGRAG